MSQKLKLDEVGYWSEIKLDILEKYAKPYNQILRSHQLRPIYIDGFAGAGHHRSKTDGRLIEGSPIRALAVEPPFEALHFVDIDGARVTQLRNLSANHSNVFVHQGDCNEILVQRIFPELSFKSRQRALCILDPYGLHLNWQTIQAAGKSKIIEFFLNFPVMDMNMNVLWHRSEQVAETHRDRMTKYWGDDSWGSAAYETTQGLFEEFQKKTSNAAVAKAFQKRLKQTAGFKYVPRPMPMRNTKGATVYYLFFAAQQPTASKIVEDIFAKYEHRYEELNG
jgi:three-Cys-motif partner protein